MKFKSSATSRIRHLAHHVDAAVRFAAMSGPFKPSDALPDLDDPIAISMVASALADVCDTRPPEGEGRWLLRTAERARVLKSIVDGEQDSLHEQARRIGAHTQNDETRDLLAVLLGRPPMDRSSIERAIDAPTSRDQLARIALALERAGSSAPEVADLRNPVRSAIAIWDEAERGLMLAKTPFRGRERELQMLRAWAQAPSRAPVQCLFVSGAPGIGKSSLLEATGRRLAQEGGWVRLRLDFDRPGLDPKDYLAFTVEAARQIGEQLGRDGSALLAARVEAVANMGGPSDVLERSVSFAQSSLGPRDLNVQIATALSLSGRRILVILDTLEVLRGRGESQAPALFDWLDGIAEAAGGLTVLAAGRGDALDTCRERVGADIELAGLSPAEATAFLADRQVPEKVRPELLRLTGGSPLKLRLASELALRGQLASLSRRWRRELDEAYLYRFLLSRIADPLLRRLAHPGLVVRRLSFAVIREVLAPALGVKDLTEAEAKMLLEELASHHWLVELGPDGVLRHRQDMRGLLLPAIYATMPRKAAAIDEAAARWYARQTESWAQVEAAYHRLQLMRTRAAQPSLSWQVLVRLEPQARLELPETAQALVLQATADRGEALRVSEVQDSELSLERELRAILQRGDWAEGGFVVDRVLRDQEIDPASRAGDALRAVLWRAGRWDQARRSLREHDLSKPEDEDVGDLAPDILLTRLELRAETALARERRRRLSGLPEPSDLGAEALKSSDNVARHGALSLTRRDRPLLAFAAAGEDDVDLAAAVWNLHAGRKEVTAAAALDLGRKRLRRWFDNDEDDDLRALAALTPYAAPAAALTIDPGRRAILKHAEAAADAILALGGLQPGQAAPLQRSAPSNPIGGIAEMGLFAEWVGAAAYVTRDRDLRTIARSAERWRRTVAGDWAYGKVPPGWRPEGRPDPVLHRRLEALLDEPEPERAAHLQIGAWTVRPDRPSGDLAQVGRNAAGRLTRIYRPAAARAGETGGPAAVLRSVLAAGAPAAFAPPLCVLLWRDHREQRHGYP